MLMTCTPLSSRETIDCFVELITSNGCNSVQTVKLNLRSSLSVLEHSCFNGAEGFSLHGVRAMKIRTLNDRQKIFTFF